MTAADEGRSLGELVASATTELSALVHEEIALAKAEIRQDVKRVLFGSFAAIVAGLLGVFAVPLFSFALAFWLRNWWDIPLALACALVGALYLVLALVLILLAKGRFSRVEPPRRSLGSARESAAVLSRVRPHPRTVPAGALADAPADEKADSAL
ncbi:phage holin family protein [Streptomyces sp. 7-21]|uniref:phage holin family protein n=1 Tax=Streptomyces sp. 7-21 TaxID=2802283 RepID=UPI00191CE6AE|nr:phage holin family protein [Streptomyces sp. 7-21]MBL1067833.1 phage holin family protein [Streptomyces sp. 7-21]